MRCEQAQRILSARMDAPAADLRLPGDVADHVATCDACRRFQETAAAVRRSLRLQPADEAPDLAGAVLTALRSDGEDATAGAPAPAPGTGEEPVPRWPLLAQAAAVFLVAAVVGAAVAVAVVAPPPVTAQELPERIVAAQADLTALEATVEVVERGWHADVPVRTYAGTLSYRAPERLLLELHDRTAYPDTPTAWTPNDTTVAVDGATSWRRGPPPCPAPVQPTCAAADRRTEAVTGRLPFAASAPVPLELVLPVDSLSVGGAITDLGTRTVAGRDAVGVTVDAAHVAPLLDGVTGTGNWREIHPTDRTEVWLDATTLVPLRVTVHAAEGPTRQRWAARRGYDDAPGDAPILELTLTDLELGAAPGAVEQPAPPGDAAVTAAGLEAVAGPPGPTPRELPGGLAAHRGGVLELPFGTVSVRSWADGRAWVRLRATPAWPGGRLFGDPGAVIRRDGTDAGTVYVGERGDVVALHGRDWDVVVEGSLATDALVAIVTATGLRGAPVPDDWTEAATATPAAARAALPGVPLPDRLTGFGAPGVRIVEGRVAAAWAGGGARALQLTAAPGSALAPPVDGEVLGVEVRGTAGRYTPSTGALEWVEDGHLVVTLRSATLGLAELVAVAETLPDAP